jgi:hypothetical protein
MFQNFKLFLGIVTAIGFPLIVLAGLGVADNPELSLGAMAVGLIAALFVGERYLERKRRQSEHA